MAAAATGFFNDKNEFEIKVGWVHKKFPIIARILSINTVSYETKVQIPKTTKNTDY